MMKLGTKGQNILEYATLICVVMAALLIMQVIIKRSYQGRIKQEADSVGQQYSPGHTASSAKFVTTIKSETQTGGKTDANGLFGKEVAIPEGMTVSKSINSSTSTHRESTASFAVD